MRRALLNHLQRCWRHLPLEWRVRMRWPADLVYRFLRRGHSFDYAEFLQRSEPPRSQWAQLKSAAQTLQGPRLGLLVDARDASDEALARSMRSLREQWSQTEAVRVVHTGDDFGHALTQLRADADYISCLRAGDELPPWAVYLCACFMLQNPNLKIFGTDEDRADHNGRHSPLFEGQFDRLRFATRPGLPGLAWMHVNWCMPAESWLAAQCQSLATCADAEVGHFGAVLLHRWAPAPSATSLNNVQGLLLESLPGGYSLQLQGDELTLRAQPPEDYPRVSVLIPTRDGLEYVQRCIDSLVGLTDYPDYEIILVDNQSADPEALEYFQQLAQAGTVTLLRYEQPFNYAAINNFAAAHATGELILLLNNDTEITQPDWMRCMADQAVRPDVGCVGTRLLYPDGRIQHAGVICGLGRLAGHPHRFADPGTAGYARQLRTLREVTAVTAACLMLRREVFEAVGGLDAEHLAVAFNDVDFCLRVREGGLRNIWLPHVSLVHHESVSRGQDDTSEKARRFAKEAEYLQQRWGTDSEVDPFYSPNLSVESEDFSLNPHPPELISRLRH